jgi:hypothetical protein
LAKTIRRRRTRTRPSAPTEPPLSGSALPERRGEATWFARPYLPIVLSVRLDYFEKEIRADLVTARTDRDARRREYLTRALAELAAARQELARYPDGAALAMAVSEAYILRQQPVAIEADQVNAGRKRGAQLAARHRRDTANSILRSIDELKARNPTLTDAAAARSHLRDTDPDWKTDTDDERQQRVAALQRRISRARKNGR